jgi:hypothetical protein
LLRAAGSTCGIHVSTGPWLNARVEVKAPALTRELHQLDRRDVDGQVEEKITLAQQRFEDGSVVIRLDRLNNVADAKIIRAGYTGLVGGHDRNPVGCPPIMTQNERQYAATNTAEANKNETTVELRVNRRLGHDVRKPTLLTGEGAKTETRTCRRDPTGVPGTQWGRYCT